MSEAKGYIKLYRQTLENPVVMKDADHIAIWIYLLLNATHKGYSILFNGKRTDLLPGQLITGRRSIAQILKISDSKVQRVLKLFEIEHQIEQQTTTKNRLISVINWNLYQSSEPQNDHGRTTTEHKQECKNDKKQITSVFFDRFWSVYPKKEGKQEALKAFEKLNPSPELLEQILKALEKQKTDREFKKARGEFVPAWKNAQGWLNGKRWMDEAEAAPDPQDEGFTGHFI